MPRSRGSARASAGSSPPRALASACVLLAVVVLSASLGGCSGGGKHAHQPSPAGAGTPRAVRRTQALRIGTADVQRVGTLGHVDRPTRRAVLAVAQRYVNRAVLAPLETGRLGPGYPSLFARGIRRAATGPDLGALTDRGVGRVRSLTESVTRVALSALADVSGSLLYVATTFSVHVRAARAAGRIAVNRRVELTLQHAGGRWLVVAYRVRVTRATSRLAGGGAQASAPLATVTQTAHAGEVAA